MKFLAPAISKIARMRIWRIKNWRNHPVAAQRDVLQDLVATAQYTEFGKAHHFSNLYSLKAFKANVPIQEYENTAPFIEKMMQGLQEEEIMQIKIMHFKRIAEVVKNCKAKCHSDNMKITKCN
jgi:hypothetical protein